MWISLAPCGQSLLTRRRLSFPVCTENLNPGVAVMESAQDGKRCDAPGLLNRARDWRIFIQGSVRSDAVVQRRLRTPTGPFFVRFFIDIILGVVAEFAFMVPSTRMVLSSSAARWKRRKQIGGLKFRPGCSTGRHVLTPGFWQLNRMSASRHLRRFPRCSIWR